MSDPEIWTGGEKQAKKYHIADLSCISMFWQLKDVTQHIFSIYPHLMVIIEKYFQRF